MTVSLVCPQCSTLLTVEDNILQTVACPSCGFGVSSHGVSDSATGIDLDVPTSDPPDPSEETRAAVEQVLLFPEAYEASELPLRRGKYLIESMIADGGFSRVYRARDEVLGRTVAIKIPRTDSIRDVRKLRMFLSEASLASKLRHPGIVTIFDVGTFEDRVPFIAMEFVNGPSLAKMIATSRPTLSVAVDLMIQIAEAVHSAIRQDIVHRDLKPGNVLIDENGTPRVVDFGLAVREDDQESVRGQVAGTPPYMSPEQFRGEAHQLDARTDIWSLGIIFYELMTGRRPFKGDVATLRDEVIKRSPKPPRQIDDTIPQQLEVICLKCLAKSPDDRYSTAKDLAEALSEWKRNSGPPVPPVSPASPSPGPATPSHRQRNRGLFLLVACLAIAGLVGMGAFAITSGGKRTKTLEVARTGIDGRAVPREWIPLLETAPQLIAWEPTNPNSTWNHDANSRRLTVSNSAMSVFSLGQTQAGSFQFQVTFGRPAWTGTVGLIFGGQPVQSEQGHPGMRYETVAIVTRTSKGKVTHQLERNICDIYAVDRYSTFQTQELLLAPIASPKGEAKLDISVDGGGLAKVLLDGLPIAEMIPFPNPGLIMPRNRPIVFGIINSRGSTTVRDARFMLTENASN